MTQKSVVILIGLLMLAVASSAQTNFSADLSSAQVVGGTSSMAVGAAELTLNVAQDALTFSVLLIGLDLNGLQTPMDTTDDVTAMHFHDAPPGMNSGIVFGLIGPNHDVDDLMIDPVAGTITGVWENTDSQPLSGQLANLLASGLYLNVHTMVFPNGAIRGQVELLLFDDGFESGDTLSWSATIP